jgi:hypothetical protein
MRSFIGPAFVPSRFWQTRTVAIAARTPIATIASIAIYYALRETSLPE